MSSLPAGEFFSETNDNSAAILLSYATARVILVGDAVETWVCSYLSYALLAAVGPNASFGWWWADPAGALAMLPVILWQGWETLEEA